MDTVRLIEQNISRSSRLVRTCWWTTWFLFVMVLCFENGDRLAASTGPSEAACSTRLPTLVIQAGHSGKEGFIRAIAVSQDGKVLATAGTDFIALWETDTGRQLRQIFLANVRSLSLSRNAGVLAVGSTDGSVSLWDPRKGTKLVDLAAKAELRCTVNNSCSCSGYEVVSSSSVQPSPVALAADGSILYFADAQGTVYKWQKGGACTRFQFRQGSRIKALSLSDDGRRLLVAAQKNGTILDTTNGEIIVEFGEHDGGVSTAALSADGQFAITGGLDHIARLWNVSSGEEIRQIVRPQSITAVAISANGARFVLGDKAGNLLSGRRDLTDTVVFDKSDSDVSTFALVPESNGDTLYFSRADIVEKWDTRSGRKLVRFTGWPKEVGALAISADGRRLAFGGWDGILRTFDFAAGKVVWSRKVGVDIRSVAFSPDSKKLITGGRDTARLWDASTGEFLYSFPRYNNGVLPASFSRGGDAILTGGDDGVLRIWSTYFPYTLRAEFDCGESVTSASFTQDGQVVIIGAGKRVIAWNWVSPSSGILIHRANGGVRAIDVSRDGSTILLADSAGDVLLLDFNTLKPRLHFQNHNDSIYAARFSADDAYVLTGSGTGKVRLWSTQSGALKTELAGHVAPVLAVSFVDSQTALSASMDRTVRAWRLKGADAGQELFRLVSFRNEENQLSHLSGREHAFDSAESWIGGGPDGHFDTNDLEENRGMHWIMPDDPLHALPLEIFMRDYYEPRLLPRLLAGEKLPEIRSLAELNRAQPKVEIVKIDSEPGAASDRTKPSDTVSVIVEVSGSSEEVGLEDKKRRMETGAYDLRLYRDGQLVKQFPAEVDESPEAGKTREQ